ncbi:MAG: alpha/beta hydrolase [Alphaproteobacteria bacterium]|nr:alpha/beta hydrolase [Alphaproteobacteria bacterium]
MYAPDPAYTTPSEIGLAGYSERILETADGEALVTWYAPPRRGQPTLLYIHGNAGTLADRMVRLAGYRAMGRGVLIMSYRGYSGSTGRPSEKDNVADAMFAYDTLMSWGIDAEDLLVYGESIGTGIAVQVAASRPVAGIILDAPYTSIVDVAERCYPFLPARLLMRDRYETLKHLDKVTAPLLVIHGEQDSIIPVEMGRKVAEHAPGEAHIATFPEAGHTDHGDFGSFEAVNDWIDRLRQKGRHRDVRRQAS